MPLTAIECKNAKAGAKGFSEDGKPKPYKLADSGSLYLLVQANGSRLWQMGYTFAGKQKTLSFGPFPAVSLSDARLKRDEAKTVIRSGRDPGMARKEALVTMKATDAITVEAVAREWYESEQARWSAKHRSEVLKSLEVHVFPHIGSLPIASITTPMILNSVLRPVERTKAIEKTHRLKQRLEQIFARARIEGKVMSNPCTDVQQALLQVPPSTPHPAILDLTALRQMLRDLENIPAHPVTRLATRLTALTYMRSNTIRLAEWSEFDLECDEPCWDIPQHKMKGKGIVRKPFLVPLCSQAVEVMKALRTITGTCPLTFPSTRNTHDPMSSNAMGYLINRAGYEHQHCPHGWRSSFSTFMNEKYTTEKHVTDFALAHLPAGKVDRVYNRAKYVERRREMAQEWGDVLLEGMMPAVDLIEMPQR